MGALGRMPLAARHGCRKHHAAEGAQPHAWHRSHYNETDSLSRACACACHQRIAKAIAAGAETSWPLAQRRRYVVIEL